MSTTQTEQTAVRYDKDADGIVTLTLDDPTASANTMNELYIDVDGRGRRPAVRRGGRPSPASWSPARRRPSSPAATSTRWSRRPTRTRQSVFELAERVKAGAAPARDLPQAGRGRDQRRRARRWPRDRAWPATTASPSTAATTSGCPRPSLGLLPGGGGVTRIVRMLGIQSGLMDVLLQGTRFKPAAGQGEGPGRRARRDPGRAGPGGQGLDQGQPRRRAEPVGRARLQDARRLRRSRRRWPASCRRSRRCCASSSRVRSTPRSRRSSRPRSRARRSTSTPRRGSSRAT